MIQIWIDTGEIPRYGVPEFMKLLEFWDIVDIWRVRNPKNGYTWRRKNPFIQSRIVYWLISDELQSLVKNVDIIPGVLSRDSAITINVLL